MVKLPQITLTTNLVMEKGRFKYFIWNCFMKLHNHVIKSNICAFYEFSLKYVIEMFEKSYLLWYWDLCN